jgi:hypothetical protein
MRILSHNRQAVRRILSCSDNTNSWIGVSLYYNQPWETFLVDAVLPYTHTAMKTGIAEQYYFLRYWERGPHVRVFFKGAPDSLEHVLKPNLEEYFSYYYKEKPSRRVEPNYPSNFDESLKWCPNNSIQHINYQADTRRYGGASCMPIAEKQFNLSSNIVLYLIKQNKMNWTQEDAFTQAIGLHLGLAHAFGLNLSEMRQFFRMSFYTWLPKAYELLGKRAARQEILEEYARLVATYDLSFANQQEQYTDYHRIILDCFAGGFRMENEMFSDWVEDMSEVHAQMSLTLENGTLEDFPTHHTRSYQRTSGSMVDTPQKRLWPILTDFIHSTNNRLGILDKNEGYLNYVLMRSLECL